MCPPRCPPLSGRLGPGLGSDGASPSVCALCAEESQTRPLLPRLDSQGLGKLQGVMILKGREERERKGRKGFYLKKKKRTK